MFHVYKQFLLAGAFSMAASLACSGGGTPPGSGGSGGSDGSGDAGTNNDAVVGTFAVRLVAPTVETPMAYTAISGRVNDGPTPEIVVWATVEKAVGCELRTPRAPFCPQGCGEGACVGDSQCSDYPKAKDVGKVQMKLGTRDVSMDAISGVYQPPGDVDVPSPPCPEGCEIRVQTSGGAYEAFSITSKGIAPLAVTTPDPIMLGGDQPLKLAWTSPAKPDESRVAIRLDISHHGGLKGEITCDVPDNGTLEIPAGMVSKLIALGTAGFPTVYLTRVAAGETKIRHGRVLLRVESSVERPLKIPGVESCHDDKDCAAPKKCQKNFKCE